MSYVQELRLLVGPRPLIIPGAAVLIIDEQNRLLLQHRKDNQQWGLIGGSMEIASLWSIIFSIFTLTPSP